MFDWDAVGKPDFLGRATALPIVQLEAGDAAAPRLSWFPIKTNSGGDAGRLLAAFQLFLGEGGQDVGGCWPHSNCFWVRVVRVWVAACSIPTVFG